MTAIDFITIENDGARVARTNFWETDAARAGKVYLSFNAGAARLLVPHSREADVADMRTAREVVISRGPWKAMRIPDAYEVLFDDGTQYPYALHLGPGSWDRLLPKSEHGRDLMLTVWTEGADGEPVLTWEFLARYRLVSRLPWLKPWEPERGVDDA
jgi:hypothetical protein